MRLKVLAVAPLIAATAACAQTHSFSSATELRSAAVNAGLQCTGYNPVTPPPSGASSAGQCVGSTSETFLVFSDDAAAKSVIEAAKKAVKPGNGVLSGPNWLIEGTGKALTGLSDSIGGSLVTGG